jgi:hypothetical protein
MMGSNSFSFIFRCSRECLKELGEDGCIDIFSRVYNIASKNEQGLFLQDHIDAIEVQRRRSGEKEETTISRGPRTASFKYYVVNKTVRTEVCFKGFLLLYDISEKRVRRIRNLKLLGETQKLCFRRFEVKSKSVH